MRRNSIKKEFFVVTLAGLLTVSLSAPAFAASKADLKQQKRSAQQQKAVVEYKIDQTQTTVAGVQNEIQKSDEKIAELDQQIAQTNQTIDDYNRQIANKQNEINTLKSQIADKQQKNDDRLRSMYMYGVEDYSTALFTSQSFGELVSRIQMIKAVAQADKNVIASMQNSQQELDKQKSQLQTIKSNLSLTKQKQEKDKAEQNSIREQQNQLLSQNTALINDYKAQVKEQEDAIASADNQLAEIAKKEAAEAAAKQAEAERQRQLQAQQQAAKQKAAQQQAAASSKTTTATPSTTSTSKSSSSTTKKSGAYIWPVSSKRITSGFGHRTSPGGIGSTNHQGVDIGASTGTPIHAIASGKVILAGWNGGYGNCVMIDHGNGIVSVYGHQSKIAVSSGQRVSQNDIIGYVGSTGHSTGPHLHLGILKNGSYVSPLNYVNP